MPYDEQGRFFTYTKSSRTDRRSRSSGRDTLTRGDSSREGYETGGDRAPSPRRRRSRSTRRDSSFDGRRIDPAFQDLYKQSSPGPYPPRCSSRDGSRVREPEDYTRSRTWDGSYEKTTRCRDGSLGPSPSRSRQKYASTRPSAPMTHADMQNNATNDNVRGSYTVPKDFSAHDSLRSTPLVPQRRESRRRSRPPPPNMWDDVGAGRPFDPYHDPRNLPSYDGSHSLPGFRYHHSKRRPSVDDARYQPASTPSQPLPVFEAGDPREDTYSGSHFVSYGPVSPARSTERPPPPSAGYSMRHRSSRQSSPPTPSRRFHATRDGPVPSNEFIGTDSLFGPLGQSKRKVTLPFRSRRRESHHRQAQHDSKDGYGHEGATVGGSTRRSKSGLDASAKIAQAFDEARIDEEDLSPEQKAKIKKANKDAYNYRVLELLNK